jgi:hypothetical protein
MPFHAILQTENGITFSMILELPVFLKITADLFVTIQKFICCNPRSPLVKSFHSIANGIVRSPRSIASHNVAGIFHPRNFIITSRRIPEPAEITS